MNSLLFLAMLSGVMMNGGPDEDTADPSWNWNDVGMMVTGADIFKVNQADIVYKDQILALLPKSKLSVHKTRTGKKSVVLVIDQTVVDDPKKAKLAKIELGTTNDVLNDGAVLLKNLQELGFKIPNQARIKTPVTLDQIKKVSAKSDKAPTDIIPSFLLGRSFDDKVTFSDKVTYLQIAHEARIELEAKTLYEAMTTKLDTKKMYERIYDKIPLRAQTFMSAAEDGVKENQSAKSQGLVEFFLVKPKAEPGITTTTVVKTKEGEQKVVEVSGGLLLYKSAAEDGPKPLIGINAQVFTLTDKDVTVKINAECFLKHVVAANLKNQGNLTLDEDMDKTKPLAGFEYNDKWLVSFKVPVARLPEDGKDTPRNPLKRDPSAVRVEWDTEYFTYLSRGADKTPTVKDDTILRLYDDQCDPVYEGALKDIKGRLPGTPMELKKK